VRSLPGILSFVKSAEAGSFTKAAQLLEISPAAVSKNVQRLEDQLSVRLFQRTTRKLSLTEEGQLFYDRCAQAVHDLDSADQAVFDHHGTANGLLRVSCGSAFGRLQILPLLPGFLAKYPQVQVDLVLDDHIADLVAERFDIAIRGTRLPDSSMVAKKIFTLQLGLFASPAYLKRYGLPVTVDDLRRHNCLHFRFVSTRKTFEWELERGNETVTVPVKGNLSLTDAEALASACAAGLGIALLAEYVARRFVKEKQLQPVLPDWKIADRQIYVCYPSRKHAPLKSKVFVDYLLNHVQP
jgi:DNA-binding transcriptional LysR family regulator